MARLEHGHHLRRGRFSHVGQIYSVTSITEQRRPLFGDWRIGRLVADEFQRTHAQGLTSSLAWVVMPDHFHWLFEVRSGSLDRILKQLKARSAIRINKVLKRDGHVWQKGFHDRATRNHEDLKTVARYIIVNPIRAGLVKRVGDYPLWDAAWL